MKTYRTVISAVLLTAVVLCACGRKAPETPETPGAEEPVSTVSAEESASVLCSDGARTLRFSRNDQDGWQWTDDVSFPLDGQYVDQLIAAARELDGLTPIADPKGPEVYGLVGSKSYLTVVGSDGSQVTYSFGSEAEGGYYCNSSADTARICVAPERILDLLGRSIYDMALLPDIPDLSADALRSVTITRGDEADQLTLSRGSWSRAGQGVTGEEQVQKLAAGLETLSVMKCVDYAPAAGAAEVCGLASPAAVLHLELDKGEFLLRVGGYDQAESAYFVTIGDDTTIYLMSGDVPALLAGWTIGG